MPKLPTVEEIIAAWRGVYVGHGVRTNKMRDDGKRYEVIRYRVDGVDMIDAFVSESNAVECAKLASDRHRAQAVLDLIRNKSERVNRKERHLR